MAAAFDAASDLASNWQGGRAVGAGRWEGESMEVRGKAHDRQGLAVSQCLTLFGLGGQHQLPRHLTRRAIWAPNGWGGRVVGAENGWVSLWTVRAKALSMNCLKTVAP